MSPPSCLLPSDPIGIVDVGAMSLGEGREAYAKLLSALPCTVVGFEPQSAECAKLTARNRPGHVYLPQFVGDGGTHTFYECNFGATSSLFEPNTALLEKFQTLSEVTRTVRTHQVQTVRLDALAECANADYLKIDVQGAELLVLEGAAALLPRIVAIELEVQFAPLYKDVPLFGDVDRYLRQRGFGFHRFTHMAGRAMKPLVVKNNVNAPLSQALWADAVYVRDFMHWETVPALQLRKLAAILHVNYSSFDLAAAALFAADRQQGSRTQAEYLQSAFSGSASGGPAAS